MNSNEQPPPPPNVVPLRTTSSAKVPADKIKSPQSFVRPNDADHAREIRAHGTEERRLMDELNRLFYERNLLIQKNERFARAMRDTEALLAVHEEVIKDRWSGCYLEAGFLFIKREIEIGEKEIARLTTAWDSANARLDQLKQQQEASCTGNDQREQS
jgi:hypothetical protein